MDPFVIQVNGRAEIPHPAERAVIHVVVTSSGCNKAAVSDQVVTTAIHVEDLLGEHSPQEDTREAIQSAAVAHWSKTSLSATSHVPFHDVKDPPPARVYDARINFDIRFRRFTAMGDFGAKLSALEHVEVHDIHWILTAATEKSYRAQLRKQAAQDALQKARDYCEVLSCDKLRPVELLEGSPVSHVASAYGNSAQQDYQMQLMLLEQQNKKRLMMARQGEGGASAALQVPASCHRSEVPLEFKPQEVRMSMDVTVKFHAE